MHPDLDPRDVEDAMHQIVKALMNLGAINWANDNIAAAVVASGKVIEDSLDNTDFTLQENLAELNMQVRNLANTMDRIADIQAAALSLYSGKNY